MNLLNQPNIPTILSAQENTKIYIAMQNMKYANYHSSFKPKKESLTF